MEIIIAVNISMSNSHDHANHIQTIPGSPYKDVLLDCFIKYNLKFTFRYSFICQGTSTRRQRSDLFGLQVKLPLPPVTTNLTTRRYIEAITLKEN